MYEISLFSFECRKEFYKFFYVFIIDKDWSVYKIYMAIAHPYDSKYMYI